MRSCLNPLTGEWVDKAEADHVTAKRELRARKAPNFDAACCHAQQCAEKWAVPFGKTHNLAVLLDAVVTRDATWEEMRQHLEPLSVYSTLFRYPGESASKDTAREALKHCGVVRGKARETLGLPS